MFGRHESQEDQQQQRAQGRPEPPPYRMFRVIHYPEGPGGGMPLKAEDFSCHTIQITASGVLMLVEAVWAPARGEYMERIPYAFNAQSWLRCEEVPVAATSGLIVQ